MGRMGQMARMGWLVAKLLLATVCAVGFVMCIAGGAGCRDVAQAPSGSTGYQGAPLHMDGTPIAPPAWWTNGQTVGRSDSGRSAHWEAVRAEHLAKEDHCAWCGSMTALQVHHIRPYHLYRGLELEDSNLVTLCEQKGVNCHLRFGHFGDFRDGWNADIRADCAIHATNSAYLPPELRGAARQENAGHAGKPFLPNDQ